MTQQEITAFAQTLSQAIPLLKQFAEALPALKEFNEWHNSHKEELRKEEEAQAEHDANLRAFLQRQEDEEKTRLQMIEARKPFLK